MPKKIGAGDRPQEYDSRTGRYGGAYASKEDKLDFYIRKWDDDYGPIKKRSNRLSRVEYRLYCQAVDNNQSGVIVVFSENERLVKIFPDDGSVVFIYDDNNNDKLVPRRVVRYHTVDESLEED